MIIAPRQGASNYSHEKARSSASQSGVVGNAKVQADETRPAVLHPRSASPAPFQRYVRNRTMSDLLFIGMILAFFLLSALCVRFCERL